VDEGVAINPLKRFVADYEMNSNMRVQIPRAPETGKKVALIGGGAEGLTCAYFLNRLGHEVTVFEAKGFLGGLLRYGIPQNRLPSHVLDWEIQGILEAGVEARLNQVLGKDFTVSGLLAQGYDAVVIAIGGWDSLLSNKGFGITLERPLPGLGLLAEFLMDHKAGKPPHPGNNVLVLEGGDAGLEAAILCKELGAKNVTAIFRDEDKKLSQGLVQTAKAKGVKVLFGAVLTKLMGEENKLTHVEVLTKGTTESWEVDSILLAAGRFPELVFVQAGEGDEKKGKWATVYPYPSPWAKEDTGLFRPGEAISDYRAVVEAIGQGRRLASTVNKYLNGEAIEPPPNMIRRDSLVLNVKELRPITKVAREKMPTRSQQELLNNPDLELELGFTEEQALREAKRCLQCGLICYRREV